MKFSEVFIAVMHTELFSLAICYLISIQTSFITFTFGISFDNSRLGLLHQITQNGLSQYMGLIIIDWSGLKCVRSNKTICFGENKPLRHFNNIVRSTNRYSWKSGSLDSGKNDH